MTAIAKTAPSRKPIRNTSGRGILYSPKDYHVKTLLVHDLVAKALILLDHRLNLLLTKARDDYPYLNLFCLVHRSRSPPRLFPLTLLPAQLPIPEHHLTLGTARTDLA